MKIQHNNFHGHTGVKLQKTNLKYMMAVFMLSMVLVTSNIAYAVPVQYHAHPELPSLALAQQQKIDEQTDLHPDWMGILTWNSTGATIAYLGPASSNPFKIDSTHWHHSPPLSNVTKPSTSLTSTKGTISPLTSSKVINVYDSIYWHYYLGGNSIYKIDQSYPLTASSTTGVDLYHWLDAKSSNTNKWLQVSAVYDYADFFATSPHWYVNFDRWDTSSCTEDTGAGFPFHLQYAFTTGSTADGYIRADSTTAGKYYMGVLSGGSGASTTFTISGDTGHNIDVGFTSNCSHDFPSGTEVEEDSTGNTYYYGTMTYQYTFYDTSTSSANTYVYSFNGKGGFGGIVTPSSTPGSSASMTFGCYYNAPYCP